MLANVMWAAVVLGCSLWITGFAITAQSVDLKRGNFCDRMFAAVLLFVSWPFFAFYISREG